jgi:TonB family protein
MFEVARKSMLGTVLVAVSILGPAAGETALRIVPPVLPVTTSTSGEVLLHVTVDATGAPERVTGLLEAPPFAESLRAAVNQWRLPATSARDVLVAGVFRSAALFELRSFPAPPPSATVPGVLPAPIEWARPGHPPGALGEGVVILEVLVGEDGGALEVNVVHSAPGFDGAAVEAARRWRFRPAVVGGQAAATVAYLVFGFRAPANAPLADRR